MIKVSFVCMGNTCRSPMAEYIFKHICKINNDKSFNVSSYGLLAEKENVINENAKKVLKKYKISFTNRKAKKLTDRLAKSKDYIFVMTSDMKNILKKYNNVYTFKDFINGIDIPDPYGLGEEEYETIFKLLVATLKKVYTKLKEI